jgi:hypothetical protein
MKATILPEQMSEEEKISICLFCFCFVLFFSLFLYRQKKKVFFFPFRPLFPQQISHTQTYLLNLSHSQPEAMYGILGRSSIGCRLTKNDCTSTSKKKKQLKTLQKVSRTDFKFRIER